jgi:hypothetical protein
MAEDAATEALSEVTKDEPDRRLIRRAVAVVKGVLAPLALGANAGVSEGVQEWAKTAPAQPSTLARVIKLSGSAWRSTPGATGAPSPA